MIRSWILVLFFLMTAASQAQVVGSNLGTSWLKISPSTRNAGMGDSMMAAGDDFDAVDLNPALLGLDRGQFLSFSQNFWAQDLSAQHLVFSAGNGGDGFGLGINYMSFGSIATYSVTNATLASTGSYSPLGLNIYAGYGLGLAPGVRAGLTAHFIYDNVQQSYPDQTAALDAGLYFGSKTDPFALALLMSNLGWNIDQATLPLEFKTTAAYWLLGNYAQTKGDILTLTGEADWFLEDLNYNQFGLGAEYWYQNRIALRAGYQFTNTGDLAGLTGLSLGAGVRYLNWQFDYALITLGDLGVANQVSLSLRWGEQPPATATPTMTLTSTFTMTPAFTFTPTATPTSAALFKAEAGKGYKVTNDTITLYSDFKSKEPHPKDVELLDEVVTVLKAHPELRISVDGYTDNRGPKRLNDRLSMERAQRVKDFLIQKGGSNDSVLWVQGHGPEDPAADNSTPEGQALNRRVVIHIVPMAVPSPTETAVMNSITVPTATYTTVTALSPVVSTPTSVVITAIVPSPVVTVNSSTPTATVVVTQAATAVSTPASSGLPLQGWWGNSFDAESVYAQLRDQEVPSRITQDQTVQLGQEEKAFIAAAQQQAVEKSRLAQMKSGYYTAVAKALIGLNRGKEAAYYLKIALSNQPDNTEAQQLQNSLQAPANP